MADKKEDVESLLKKLSSCQLSHSDPISEKNKIESISRLRDLNGSYSNLGLDAIRGKAKETFSTIMLIRPGDKERDKRMPSKDQLKVLKAIDPALCKTLRDGTVRDFYKILYPKPEEDLQGTVFCLDGTEKDHTIFEDLTERAELLAKEIKLKKVPNSKIKCYLMDGHGRMLLCLIKALIKEGLDPDNDVEFTICELDDVVHEYHQHVFPSSVVNKKQNVLQDYGKYIENNSVVYLNFCSVPSSQDNKTWTSHPRCVKQNVLRFVWELTQPGKNCSVMVSLVIRDTIADSEKEKLFPIGGNDKKYVTGLGFLKVIRDKELFNSEDGDILLRPDSKLVPDKISTDKISTDKISTDKISTDKIKGIPWDDPNTKRKPNQEGIKGYSNQVFASVMIHPKGKEQTKVLIKWFDNNNIAYDSPNDIIPYDMVKITSEKDKGYHGLVIGRNLNSAKVVYYEGNDQLPKTKYLTSCQKLPENKKTIKMWQWIRGRIGTITYV